MIGMSLLVWLFASFAALLAPPVPPLVPPHVASAEAGQRVFRMCAACHPVAPDGRHTIGTNLFAIMDRPAGTQPGYAYSAALKAKGAAGLVWNDANMRAYLTDPRSFMPGGKMAYAGLKDADRMDDLIAYLRALR